MHDILTFHPETSMSKVKEINFFTYKNKYKQGLKYYSTYFDKKEAKIIGESSLGYIFYPGVANLIKKDLGQIKVLILLREPIKRAFSQYWDNRRQLSECLTEDEII